MLPTRISKTPAKKMYPRARREAESEMLMLTAVKSGSSRVEKERADSLHVQTRRVVWWRDGRRRCEERSGFRRQTVDLHSPGKVWKLSWAGQEAAVKLCPRSSRSACQFCRRGKNVKPLAARARTRSSTRSDLHSEYYALRQ